jgi:hypothetical protein
MAIWLIGGHLIDRWRVGFALQCILSSVHLRKMMLLTFNKNKFKWWVTAEPITNRFIYMLQPKLQARPEAFAKATVPLIRESFYSVEWAK